MTKTKKNILYTSIFLIIFMVLLLLATFFDLQVSNILASDGLKNGNYYSTNLFGQIFEVIGEIPIYIFISISLSVFIIKAQEIQNKYLRIITQIIIVLVSAYSSYRAFYIIGKNSARLNSAFDMFYGNTIVYVIYYILGIGVAIGLTFLVKKLIKDRVNEFISYALIILLTALFSQIIVQGSKLIFCRERYRAIMYFDYKNMEHGGYNYWFIINPSPAKQVALYGGQNDYFKSFPSGHTCAAGITYTLMLLPLYFKKLDNKKGRILCLLIPLLITGIVALSRIVMGAHYFSDVLVGGTATFVSVFFAKWIINAISKKISKKQNV